jgi:hypothetical protein
MAGILIAYLPNTCSSVTITQTCSAMLWTADVLGHVGCNRAVFFSSSLLGSLLPLLQHRAEFPKFLDQRQSVGLL